MMKLIKRFRNDENGATAIEYGLIAALIALAIMAGAGTIGTEVGETFTTIGTKLETANTP